MMRKAILNKPLEIQKQEISKEDAEKAYSERDA